VAWHEQNGGLGQSRIRFASLRTTVLPYKWTENPPIISTASGYNINVGMDFDTSGGYVVTWYRFAPGQSAYTNIGTYVRFDAAGNPVGESPSNVTGRTGDVRHYRPDSVPCNAETPPACCVGGVDICSVGRRYIGEYHDVSFTNGRFKCAHLIIGLPDTGETIGDPWVFIVSHVIP
jgi:hypothetical protein